MVTGTNQWDIELINDICEEMDANLIFSVPICNVAHDSWYWRREKLDHYWVNGVYYMIQEGNYGTWRFL